MAQSEFSLIDHYFKHCGESRDDVLLGIGDDCALLQPAHGEQLAISTDTLIADIHFPADTRPFDIGYKTLAVNLSDLAAMGATPAWATLAITLPSVDENWLGDFCKGFAEIANRYQVALVGGDTTHGPTLSISVQVMGQVTVEHALKRTGAMAGDTVFVSNTLGSAALGLAILQQRFDAKKLSDEQKGYFIDALNRPEPQCHFARGLKAFASSELDISDGLLADLGHILKASDVGAELRLSDIPMHDVLRAHNLEQLALNGGDDYQLCFTVPKDKLDDFYTWLGSSAFSAVPIGQITEQKELRVLDENGNTLSLDKAGYDHFSAN